MKNIYYLIAVIFLAITVTSCKESSVNENKKINDESPLQHTGTIVSKEQFDTNKMKLENITEQTFSTTIKVTGMIDAPPQSVEIISSFSGGYIKNSSLLVGDAVKKGQALVTIENPDFIEMQQEYLEIVEQMTYLKSEYERQKLLFEEKITSQKSYLKAESDYKKNLAITNGTRKKLQMLNINPTSVEQGKIISAITLYASISGNITEINVSKGAYVSPADVIIKIVNTDHIHIELTAFEKDLMQIKEGQKIKFKIPEASNTIFDAEVHLVGTSINEATRTATLHGHLNDDEKHNFAIGMFVDAEIEISSNQSKAIQENAIIENDDKTVVLVLKSFNDDLYSFETRSVTIGKKQDGFVEITSENIKPTDKILTNGAYGLITSESGGD
ncbi:MAG: efflux RND transporter periplasmic adaptor subunit [Urechidicola sp.]|nr:efflux RND transporter periplasmic adaptor subunit [Urechidicola sp.]